jgi:prepilin-type N-terminal cleavage/methylation domain-containing protein
MKTNIVPVVKTASKNPKVKHGTAGFTLVEILFVIAIAAIILGGIAFNMAGGMTYARAITAKSDIRQLSTAVQYSANQCGGTLPLTEAGATLPDCTGAALGGSAVADFYNHARLEQVLMSVPNAIIDKYWQPSIGSQMFSRADDAASNELMFDTSTMKWKMTGADQAVPAGMSYANVSRLECRVANKAAVPGTDGSNFYVNGDINVPVKGTRVAYAVYKNVTGEAAYILNRTVNGSKLNTDTTKDGTTAQTLGVVTYAATGAAGTTDVYVFLGSW